MLDRVVAPKESFIFFPNSGVDKLLCVVRVGDSISSIFLSMKTIILTNLSRDSRRHESDNVRRGYKLQDRGIVQRRSGSRQHVVAQRHSGREARLAWGGIREHEHGVRGLLGIRRVGVSIASGRHSHGAGKGKGTEWGNVACHHHHVCFVGHFYVFRLSASMEEVIGHTFSRVAITIRPMCVGQCSRLWKLRMSKLDFKYVQVGQENDSE